MNPEEAIHRILSALFNGGYQGLLLAFAVGVSLKGLPRANAATRHGILLVALVLVAALPLLHFLLSFAGGDTSFRSRVVETISGRSDSEGITEPALISESQVDFTEQSELRPELASPAPQEIFSDFQPAESMRPVWVEPELISEFVWNISATGLAPLQSVPPVTPETYPNSPEALPEDSSSNSTNTQPWRLRLPAGVGLFLFAVWAMVALPRLALLGRQCQQLLALKRQASPAPAEWQSLFHLTGAEMGLKRKTALFMGPSHSGPMIAGFRNPAVLLPSGMFERASAAQLVQVLRHELGHVIRYDDWTNLLQQIIRAVFFFHPAVHWLSGRLTLEREVACDDHVLAATRAPRAYALLLTEFASRSQGRALAAAPAAWNRQTQLKQRITMILDANRNSSPRLAGASTAVLLTSIALFTGLVLQAAPRLVLDGETATAAASETESTVVVQPQLTVSATVEADPQPVIVEISQPVPVPAPASVETSIVVSGPRIKSPPELAVISGPAPALERLPASPTPLAIPPTPPAARTPPNKSLMARTSDSPKEPSGPATGRSARSESSDSSMERRLVRLERMMEELMAQLKNPMSGSKNSEFALKLKKELEQEKTAKRAAQAGKDGLNREEIERITEQSRQNAQQAMREVERATREIERATAQAVASVKAGKGNPPQPAQHDLEIQKNVLEATRHSLEEQIKSIERQLEKLEAAKERVEEQVEEVRKNQKNANANSNKNSENKSEGEEEGDGPRKKTLKF